MSSLEQETLSLLDELEQALGSLLAGIAPEDYGVRNRLIHLVGRTRHIRGTFSTKWKYIKDGKR